MKYAIITVICWIEGLAREEDDLHVACDHDVLVDPLAHIHTSDLFNEFCG